MLPRIPRPSRWLKPPFGLFRRRSHQGLSKPHLWHGRVGQGHVWCILPPIGPVHVPLLQRYRVRVEHVGQHHLGNHPPGQNPPPSRTQRKIILAGHGGRESTQVCTQTPQNGLPVLADNGCTTESPAPVFLQANRARSAASATLFTIQDLIPYYALFLVLAR